MASYQARMLHSVSGAEGVYKFENRDNLLDRPADDAVAAFFDYADREVFSRGHIEYELNGVVKNKKQKTIVAIGSMRMDDEGDDDWQPFTIFISPA